LLGLVYVSNEKSPAHSNGITLMQAFKLIMKKSLGFQRLCPALADTPVAMIAFDLAPNRSGFDDPLLGPVSTCPMSL
jgi:hypothetical protein